MASALKDCGPLRSAGELAVCVQLPNQPVYTLAGRKRAAVTDGLGLPARLLISSKEKPETPSQARRADSLAMQESGDRAHWCVVAYWEEKTRVGRLYSVQEASLDIFYDLPQGNGFCLGQLCSENKSQLVQMVRAKIGYGIQLTREPDGVWVYNRSCYPIFIKSATLDNPDTRTLLVHKVFPGFSIKAFDYDKAGSLQRPNDHEFTQQPRTGFTVQISFVKGWGQCYTRQFISSCPCWLEVIFNTR
ncbi:Mothers against decapentaplegic -like protein 7 [Takifugu flavidus]|uniref:Mothers against decapentaplegic-like protein 7 n=1 Tax=Takifugu flavidus TaxID=433684 RepID=A0A5C6NIQ4_9TELE|nr:Mothers against decapentaplegic -like protein 7 [Takifugu flavidus]